MFDFTSTTNESGVEQALMLELVDAEGVRSAHTFDVSGLMTHDRGVLLRLDNGAEFQLTVVQSDGFADEDEADDE